MGQISREKLLIILLVLILAVSGTITWQGQVRLNELTAQNESLNQEIQKLQQEKAGLTDKVAELEKVVAANGPLMAEEIITQKLKDKGLTIQDLKKALMERTDLIQHSPVLGGTMYFPESGIRVITDRWVLAEFEDGHIGGCALIEYQIKAGQISWKVLESYVYQ